MVAPKKVALTDRFMKALKPAPQGRRDMIWDAVQPYLGVRVTDKGQRSFVVVKRQAGDVRPTRHFLGTYPGLLINMTPDLQKLQTKRNRIVHEFGTDGDRRTPWDPLARIQASASECERSIRLVSSFIKDADELFGPIIGGHEVLAEYHRWSQKQKNLRHLRVSGKVAHSFGDFIGKMYGRPLGVDYTKQMITYYESL